MSSIDNPMDRMYNKSSYDASGLAQNTSKMEAIFQSINSEFGMHYGSLSSSSESELESDVEYTRYIVNG